MKADELEASSEALIPSSSEMIARNACNYSRAFIYKGSTQLINNCLNKLQREALDRAIWSLRNFCGVFPEYGLEINEKIQTFYHTIAACKKYSLGNCYELALMALYYVLKYCPNSNAEVYSIEGGDHAFLVIGRNASSDPSKPSTWGNKVYICDPWANEVYLASEYLTKTKNYYSHWWYGTNHIEDFNCKKHSLLPIPFRNTKYLRQVNSQQHLVQLTRLHQDKINVIIKALEELQNSLTAIIAQLAKKYPDNEEKSLIIKKMITQLQLAIEVTKKNIMEKQGALPYEPLRSTLESSLKDSVRAYTKAVKISAEDKLILAKYNNNHKFATKCLRFFKIPTKTIRDTNKVLNKTNKKIKNAIKRPRYS
jgi:hypothetical protein